MAAHAKLLDTAGITYEGNWLEFPASKTSAFLCYLAYQQDWTGRDDLVYLFWPDLTEERARRNLRRLLFDIKSLPYTGDIEIEVTRLRWPIETDVHTFTQALTERRQPQAVDLYRGELLSGFKLPREPEFEAWLTSERQVLHQAWREAIFSVTTDLAGAGRYQEAAELLARLTEADPLDEEALQSRMHILHLAGQQRKALRIFERFKSNLKNELGGEPTSATLQLLGQVQQELPLDMPMQSTSHTTLQAPAKGFGGRRSLPLPPTRFVGRKQEKTTLSKLLADPQCRLLTLLGAGGIGKTRLAIEIAQAQLGSFPLEVTFVPLTDVTSTEFMIYAIADALGFSFFGNADPKQQLLTHLRDKAMLLVLDNFEHLLAGVELVTDMMAAAPGIKVLVTSREILNLQAEQVFELSGLSVPEERAEAAEEYDAVRLFVQRAKNRRPDLQLDQGDTQAITRICRLVGGMPLAIELAASWVHVLTPQDIADEVEQGIGFLQAARRDLPERHRSVRAVFDRSWNLLTKEEQQVVGKLAVFSGGFNREAAAEVAGAGLSVLANLVDKSFLSTTPTGRYKQHPLIQQHGREKLAENPQEQARTEEMHGQYFLHVLQQLERGLRQRDLRKAVAEDVDNIKAAWRWAITEVRVEEIRRSVEPMYFFFGMSRHPGGHAEGLELLTQALTVLDERNRDHRATLGYVLVEQSEHLAWLSRLEQAHRVSQRALELLEPLGETRGLIIGYWVLGYVAQRGGDDARAEMFFEKSLLQAKDDLPWYRSVMQLSLLNIKLPHASPPEARKRYLEFLAELKALGETDELIIALQSHYGTYLIEHNRPQEAQPLLEESLKLARELEAHHYLPSVLTMLATTTSQLGDHQKAQELLLEALQLAEEHGLKGGVAGGVAEIWEELGKVMTGLGDDQNARSYLLKALELARSIQDVPVTFSILLSLIEIHLPTGRHDQAATWLTSILHHPSAPSQAKKEARRLLDRIQDQASPAEITESQARAKVLTLREIIEEFLPQH